MPAVESGSVDLPDDSESLRAMVRSLLEQRDGERRRAEEQQHLAKEQRHLAEQQRQKAEERQLQVEELRVEMLRLQLELERFRNSWSDGTGTLLEVVNRTRVFRTFETSNRA
jgi:predicted  nucleic acid-binding Zn-ribbon protein